MNMKKIHVHLKVLYCSWVLCASHIELLQITKPSKSFNVAANYYYNLLKEKLEDRIMLKVT